MKAAGEGGLRVSGERDEKSRCVVGLTHHVVRVGVDALRIEPHDSWPRGGQPGADPQSVLMAEIGKFSEEPVERL